MEPRVVQGALRAEGLRFAIVVSRFNDFVTNRLLSGALDALERLGAEEKNVVVYRVPGSFELPLMAKRLATSGRWDAIICLGTIIRGETPHFDYVAAEAAKGIATAAMETGVPIVFGVITADTLEQAIDRAGAKSGNKGFEAALTAVELANLYREA
ncbi:MAG: 6,7-dimethyl-8-ribityllumazine synthase [Blastocatellia bacterium]|nr:6,7-dimethyl-8-ribityllumazine synthase [Blastocatellia bacterium]MCS7158345.1 6,7-dimethyl-8-ribityllumazine synthase [Blastocatellia bacterium]MCX7752851.1 6,7-dimethyl-8-ribityllumazine synthase [Blastocatellia bacterium]MDW8167907.1 6,7-dimethyl-8-ribityllumazine synthase [Acidobacteriota bacterium]MDW8255932.1 6,7-dimethyl-8-ribityllumazine synthase [Acidobacteriota bacterium]